MPRQPTGNPRGRPPGTGQLGTELLETQTRLTVRIPQDLYERFEAFVASRRFHRGKPFLAASVREALEHFLTCQAPPGPHTATAHSGQTGNDTPAPVTRNKRQTGNVQPQQRVPMVLTATRQTDTQQKLASGTYHLGDICKRGHAWLDTGQSVRTEKRECVQCKHFSRAGEKARRRARQARTPQARHRGQEPHSPLA
jgi:hypothetical protein